MSEAESGYKESLLQWIWANLEFECSGLKTECGKKIRIIDNGKLNHGAGPDFLDSKIEIGSLCFHGHVEIHKKAQEWNYHDHQYDASFNNVILHVVFSNAAGCSAIQRIDGTSIPTLNLDPYLSVPLSDLLAKSRMPELPCGKHIRFINQEAFGRQIRQVHQNYFSYKADELIRHYNGSLPVSEAWRQCLTAGIYYTLGMPGNRNRMLKLFKLTAPLINQNTTLPEALNITRELAFGGAQFSWMESGIRPANHPEQRTKQAVALHNAIIHVPFQNFIKNGISCWDQICSALPADAVPGKQMQNLLYFTVFLPACWLLGDLLHSAGLKQSALEEWNSRQQQIPAAVKKPFKKAGFEITQNLQKLGVAHQLKRYCRPLQCQHCEVFKSAIRS